MSNAVVTPPPTVGRLSTMPRLSWKSIRRNLFTCVGAAILAALVLIAILADVIAPYPPTTGDPTAVLEGPSSDHWFGTDDTGFDVFSRVLHATRIDLYIAGMSVILATFIGAVMGGVSAYVGGLVDELFTRLLDLIAAFPSFILAMALVVALGATPTNLIIAITITEFPTLARLVRAQVLSARESNLVLAARSLGCRPGRILFRHVLPNSIAPMIIQAALSASYAILTIAGLSYIGLGIQPPTPEWGVMINNGTSLLFSGYWWVSFFPGVALALTILSLNLLGDGLGDMYERGTK